MKVGDQFLTSSISIMESDDMHFLFGLDMLRRHQCQIDLAANVLRFTNLGIALPFLQGADLPTKILGVSGATIFKAIGFESFTIFPPYIVSPFGHPSERYISSAFYCR